MTKSTSRRGWRETLEPGVYRVHRLACDSSRDRRKRRRCGCPLAVAVPGPTGGSTLHTLELGATLLDARRAKARAVAAGRPAPPRALELANTPTTVRDLARAYLRARASLLAPATVRTLEDGLRLALPVVGHVALVEFSRSYVEQLVARLLGEDRSAHACRKAVAALRPACSYAVEHGWLAANPCARVRVPEPPAAPGVIAPAERVLSAAELERLYAATADDVREEVMLRLGGDSGLRSGEVRGLAWPDVDLAARRLHVRRSIWRREPARVPKGRRARRVAISPQLAEALSRLYALEVVSRGRDATGFVLVGRDGSSAVSTNYPLDVAARAQQRAGLVVRVGSVVRPRVTFHQLRHTRASLALRDGIDLVTVARQLGHAGPHITATVYAHLIDDGSLDAVTTAGKRTSVAGDVAGAPTVDRSVSLGPA